MIFWPIHVGILISGVRKRMSGLEIFGACFENNKGHLQDLVAEGRV